MRRFIIISLAVLISLLTSCGAREKKVPGNRMIPTKDLIPILTDIYIADGLLAYQPVRNNFNAKDSIVNYIEIIEKHGYTKQRMDMTLKHYFINNPKKLQKIYDQVLARLSEIQSEIETQSPVTPEYNLWNQKPILGLPEEGVHNPLFFSIPVKDTGLYTLSFEYFLFTDDQSLNPRTTVYFWHTDSTDQGVKDMWERTDLVKDGIRHSLVLSRRLTDTVYTHICGWLHDCDPQTIRWEKHSKFSNILLTKGMVE